MYTSLPKHSRVVDYNKIQGTTHPTDLHVQIIRDYNVRHVSIENSSTRPIGIAVTTYVSGPTPPILHSLAPSEIKHLGINSQGGPPQYLWILDLDTKKVVGKPSILRRDANSFVLRDGVNKWWVQFFKFPSVAAAK
jgi:hypothetical protein